MKHIHFIGVMIILFAEFFPQNLSADTQDVVIVGNENAADSVTKGEIKEIFLGKKTRWDNNAGLTFVLFRDEKHYETFLKEYVGKTASQYSSYWKIQVFNGTGRMPLFLKDKTEVISFVSGTLGAIGFVGSGDIRADKVKIIKVNP